MYLKLLQFVPGSPINKYIISDPDSRGICDVLINGWGNYHYTIDEIFSLLYNPNCPVWIQ